VSPASPATGVPLGAFVLDRVFARGGMGDIWSGVHRETGLPVAVKVLGHGLVDHSVALTGFRREIRAVAALDHPGIVMILDQGIVTARESQTAGGRLLAGSPYLVMELASGGSLSSLRRSITWPGLRELLLAVLDALAYAHAREVIHRDIKPGNVIRCTGRDLRPGWKLTDFGIAHLHPATDRWDSEEELIVGSPSYIAPEQAMGEWRRYGPWTDLYSLACLGWICATGKPVFRGRNMGLLAVQHIEQEPPAFVARMDVPDGFEGWLRRLLNKAPSDRYRRAADAARALEEIGDASPPLHGVYLPKTWRSESDPPTRGPRVGAGLGLWGLKPIPMVDRREVRDALWMSLRQVHKERRPRTVILQGPSGTGKSRVALWMGQRAHELGAGSYARGVHDPIGGRNHGVAPMLARRLRCAGLSGAPLQEYLRGWLREHGGDEQDTQPLARLFSPEVEARRADGPGRGREGAERYALLARTLARAAGDRPIVVILEDVQWGRDTLGFVEFLHSAPAPADLPLLLVLTIREEDLAPRVAEQERVDLLAGSPAVQRLRVGPLAPSDHGTLVKNLLGLEDELARRVARRTAGNPMFAVLLVDDWVRRGVLRRTDSGLRVVEGEEASLPDDVLQLGSDLLAEALGDLPEDALIGLELVAALGATVDPVELEAACRYADVAPPSELLERLAARKLATWGEDGWTISHAMLREVLRGSSRSQGRWASHNVACAAAVTELYASGPGVRARVGRHLLEGGDPDAALGYLLEGARESVDLDDYAEARALLDEAAAAAASAGTDLADARRGDALVLRAMLHYHRDEYDDAVALAREAVSMGSSRGWERVVARGLAVRGHVARRRGAYVLAEDLLSQALARYEALGDPGGVAECKHGLSSVALRRGRYDEAARLLDTVFDYAEATDDTVARVAALSTMAELDRHRGKLTQAQQRLQAAVFEARRIGHLWYVGFLLNSLGELERAIGQPDFAIDYYRDSVEAFAAAGSPQGVIPRFNMAFVELQLGRFTEARDVLEQALAEVRARQWGALEAHLGVALCVCAAGRGDWDEFARHREASWAAMRDSGAVDPDACLHARMAGDLAHRAGRVGYAREAWLLARDLHLAAGEQAAADELVAKVEGLG